METPRKRWCIVATSVALGLAAVATACDNELTAPIATPATAFSVGTAAIQFTTLYYGDFDIDGTTRWMPGNWDLTAGPVILRYTADIRGAPNIAYTGDWSQQAMAGLHSRLDNSTGARMVAFNYDSGLGKFPTYPDHDATLDIDDKVHLQRFPNSGSWSESMYDVRCLTNYVEPSPFGSGVNYGVWFDRDGVDAWQPSHWGAVDGGTYNTLGIYDIRVEFRKAANYQGGTACAEIAPDLANDDAPDGTGVHTGFNYPPTPPPDFPAGLSFGASDEHMASMGVALSGSPGNGEILLSGVTVTGHLVLESGMATGGGWFIPEPANSTGITTDGSKATFGFNAKQKDGSSTGQLEFQYKADGLILKSDSYDWVTLAATQVMFEGTGTLNGETGFRFRVRAVDGDLLGTATDRFEIRIWTDGGSFDSPTYRAEGDLGGGQVVAHNK